MLLFFLIYYYSPFDFEAFKRVYSNEDTIEKAIPWFWEKFDKETMSIWHCEYLFPEELSLVFMTSNLVGGKCWLMFNSVSTNNFRRSMLNTLPQ